MQEYFSIDKAVLIDDWTLFRWTNVWWTNGCSTASGHHIRCSCCAPADISLQTPQACSSSSFWVISDNAALFGERIQVTGGAMARVLAMDGWSSATPFQEVTDSGSTKSTVLAKVGCRCEKKPGEESAEAEPESSHRSGSHLVGDPILEKCVVETVGVHEGVACDNDLCDNETESEDEVWANQTPDVTINGLGDGFWARVRSMVIRSIDWVTVPC